MEYDIIVVGGGPAGIISAVTSRKYNPEKKILLLKSIKEGVIPCGIPYMFTTLKNPEDNKLGNLPLEKNKIDLEVDEVIDINKRNKLIKTKNNHEFKYKKLVLAMGSIPIVPLIPGIEKKGVYPIHKEMNYLKKLKKVIKHSKNIVIIGGGFIGVEFADELAKLNGVTISIIELLPEVLANSFDIEFCKLAKQKLEENNIQIYTGLKAEKIIGEERVESVLLSNEEKIPADIVILGIGAKPNKTLAENSGLKTNKHGIVVDKHLRTSNKNIFAVGDCCEKKDFFTKERTSVMLASAATTQARIAGHNLFTKNPRAYNGTIASYSTKIGDLSLSSTGITERTAKEKGLDIITGIAESFDKHPANLPDSSQVRVKLVFSKKTKILLGGQILGGDSVGEMINILSTGIQKKFTINEIESLQIATHPKLTPPPTTYPIINAAQNALQHLK